MQVAIRKCLKATGCIGPPTNATFLFFSMPLVEADVGIIVGKSKSLLTDCERSGVQVIDLVEQ